MMHTLHKAFSNFLSRKFLLVNSQGVGIIVGFIIANSQS